MILLFLATLAWGGPAGAPAVVRNNEPGILRHMQMGTEFFESGRYAQALDEFFWVLEVAPENVEAKTYMTRIGETWLQLESRASMPPRERALAMKEVALLLKKRKERLAAMELQLLDIRRQIEKGASNPQGLLQASRSLSVVRETEIGDRIMAEQSQRYLAMLQAELRKAISRDGTFQNPKDVLIVRGYLWYYRGNMENALREWQRAYAMAPEDALLREQIQWASKKKALLERSQTIAQLTERARDKTSRRQFEQAVLDWRSLVILDPQNDEYQRALIKVENELRKDKAARALAKAARAMANRRLTEASDHLIEVLNIDPTNREALDRLKTIQKQLFAKLSPRSVPRPAGESVLPARAEAVVSERQAEDQYTLGLIYYSQGELDKAKRAIEQARKADPGNDKFKNAFDRIQAELNP
ncbi:MAG: tetratricopeptide repeat protein [Elusimicrobia bacterium]|nr:tetratricopeptide repeat protein [Elusimicrobiota bacterium]